MLRDACDFGHVEIVKLLMSAGADTDKPGDDYACTTLHRACLGGCVEAVKVLLDAGADKKRVESKDSRTPLHCACAVGDAEVVQVLLEAGANPRSAGEDGATMLHTASTQCELDACCCFEVVQIRSNVIDVTGVCWTLRCKRCAAPLF